MKNLIAQVPLSPPDGFHGTGPLGLEGREASESGGLFEGALSTTIGVLTFIGGIFFLVNLLLAGVSYISAGNDPQKVEGAQKRMMNSLIGLVIVISAFFAVALVGRILGFNTILNPASIIPG